MSSWPQRGRGDGRRCDRRGERHEGDESPHEADHDIAQGSLTVAGVESPRNRLAQILLEVLCGPDRPAGRGVETTGNAARVARARHVDVVAVTAVARACAGCGGRWAFVEHPLQTLRNHLCRGLPVRAFILSVAGSADASLESGVRRILLRIVLCILVGAGFAVRPAGEWRKTHASAELIHPSRAIGIDVAGAGCGRGALVIGHTAAGGPGRCAYVSRAGAAPSATRSRAATASAGRISRLLAPRRGRKEQCHDRDSQWAEGGSSVRHGCPCRPLQGPPPTPLGAWHSDRST